MHLFPDIADRRVDRPERVTLKGEIPSPVSLPEGCYLYGRCPSQVAAVAGPCRRCSKKFRPAARCAVACGGRGANGLELERT